jgi:ABC-type multidrug transport system fused ATPase/permease subunit
MQERKFNYLLSAFGLLNPKEMRYVAISIFVQLSLSFLDLIGIFTIGLVVSRAINGESEGKFQDWYLELIDLFDLTLISQQSQFLILISFALALLVARTLLSILFTKQIIWFFSNFSAELSGRFNKNLLNSKLMDREKYTTQEIVFSSTRGVEIVSLDILANLIVIVSDLFFLTLIVFTLFYVDVATGVSVVFLFLVVGFALFYTLQSYTLKLGTDISKLSLEGNEIILEAFSSPRETHVKNLQDYYVDRIVFSRKKLAKSMAGIHFVPYLSKYVIEITIVLGSAVYGTIQFFFGNSNNIAETFSIFLLAATRSAPSALRVQQGILQMKGSVGKSMTTLDMIYEFEKFSSVADFKFTLKNPVEVFTPSLILKDVTYTYPTRPHPTIKGVTLKIEAGQFVAIVGPSGAGKSTLVDCMLGIIDPTSGEIELSGKKPDEAITLWPGKISYVPQDTFILNDSIRANIYVGSSGLLVNDKEVLEAIESASLSELLTLLPEGLDTVLGERGSKLSGGQKQRVGLARALLSNPGLLIMDEATSALDQTTQEKISQSISGARKSRTVIVIAHRMETIIGADLIVYLEDGVIKATGNLNQVMEQVPDFQKRIQPILNNEKS